MVADTFVSDTILLPDAPRIPGLSFRGFRGEADYPKMLAVISGSKDVDGVERVDTLDDITRNYAHLTNCDPYQDMIFAEVNGEVIGYSRVTWFENNDDQRIYMHFGFLMPVWRRRGIGRAMLKFDQRRLREIAAGHPDDKPKLFEAQASDPEVASAALLVSEGFAPVRYGLDMVRSLNEPVEITPLPGGLEIRPALPEHYRQVWEADQEAFRDHWGFVAGTEMDYQRWLADALFQPNLWKIAWEGDQVAGMVLNFLNQPENEAYGRKRGYTEGISVRRPWRKRGLARALLTRSLQMFKDMGMTEAALGVDSQNLSGALRLYESVGFRTVRRLVIYRKPFEQGEV